MTGIHPKHLRDCIIRPSLKPLHLWSPSADTLLLLTAATESHCGRYLKQIDSDGNPVGPALTIYEFEPPTYKDMLRRSSVYKRLHNSGLLTLPDDPEELIFDLKGATIACRLIYTLVPERLPKHDNILEMARYWKRYYNTSLGKGEVTKAIEDYEKCIARYL